MSQHTPHELTTVFKNDRELLTQLKTQDKHFAKLADSYHEVNRAVHRHEIETETLSDDHAEELKKQRLALLDDLTAIVNKAREAAV